MRKIDFPKIACIVCVCAIASASSAGQNFKLVASFDYSNGDEPYSGSLIEGTDGNFYGTTEAGGAHGNGTVFKMTPGGALTALYSFGGGADGGGPYAGLTQGIDGNFYGTTEVGGTTGYGTVFAITPAGTLITLHSFSGTDGANPYAGLIQGTDGNLYGTTEAGGVSSLGTVFRISPDGVTFTTLHNFAGSPTDGANPYGGLTQGTDGNFYGTTESGGAHNNCADDSNGCGTVFTTTPAGTVTVLYSFAGPDGYAPEAGLAQGADGNFYGTTSAGGTYDNCILAQEGCGTVFRITPAGRLTTLHNFDGSDGASVSGGLVQATNGNFYGTTTRGSDFGTLFTISTVGTLSVLHTFGVSGGALPYDGLTQARNGSFFGTTPEGGATTDFGTVFSLSPGLGTTTVVSPSLDPAAVNQDVTFTATVVGDGGTPTGTVTFVKNGSVVLETVALSGGQASLNQAFAAGNTKNITAIYNGDADFAPSTSAILFEGVGGNPTSTVLASSQNASVTGQSVTFTATVSSTFGSPTGTVTFLQNGFAQGMVALSDGRATFTKVFGSANIKSFTAVYSGDASFAVSTSSVLYQTVNK